MAELSPMMQQYMKIKEEYKDCVLFYRVGDFYEMFFDDAKQVSRELELALTGKDCGLEERAPMCGIPFRAYETYANRLVELGHKVAICEQVEDPKTTKGLVKREVIQIITPGTNFSTQNLNDGQNNYLMCIFCMDDSYGIAVSDITTGETRTCRVDSIAKCKDEIAKYVPVELICNEAFLLNKDLDVAYYRDRLHIMVEELADWYFHGEEATKCILKQYKVSDISALGLDPNEERVIAVGAMLRYLFETQKMSLNHINHLEIYTVDDYMVIDSATRRNLELTETMRDKGRKGSLMWVLDKTKTAMGARFLMSAIEQPLIRKDRIEMRYDAIERLNAYYADRDELREYLNSIYDLERLMTRISLNTANARDLLAFKSSLLYLPDIAHLLQKFGDSGALRELFEELDTLTDLYDLLEASIAEDPPVTVKEGGIIKAGYLEQIDHLKEAKLKGKQWLADLEAKEREVTGIKGTGFKIKYNPSFGYYFDVTNSYKDRVPDYFIRKQTLVNSERYTTPELDEIAHSILGSEDKLFALEYETFCTIRQKISNEIHRVQQTAHAIAKLDFLCSIAYVASHNNYHRPMLNEEGRLTIVGGRHPVVERMLPNDSFIKNDTTLDIKENRIAIITGPNMAGKSTYMRQTALITLLAQVGSFVPADSADIGIVDRIFTRVGASDDLASGQSTFMVEMNEVANILNNATPNSLIVLDEIGRGTSTYDGLSIAWAVVEYISNLKNIGAKTLFATHYHELTQLEGNMDGVHNYCIAVKERGDDIIFLRQIMKGNADRSYGIQVAKLAGLPDAVIARAKEILNDFVGSKGPQDMVKVRVAKKPKPEPEQLSFFTNTKEQEVLADLRSIDLSNTTPMKALTILSEIQEKLH